ncbi:putative orfan [Tupanvirus soda lake]|uniref:Orfan n=2 Tax=Tupanvirus TaxID=2094720 RepID=A0AC62ACB0_9VIRU|nr:putative orfan [Tupanvirus soda lake]QKU35425.1 putative orfan [Tupanvirus soda lake]
MLVRVRFLLRKNSDRTTKCQFCKKKLLKYFADDIGRLKIIYPYYKNYNEKHNFKCFLANKFSGPSKKHSSKDILDTLCVPFLM